MPAAPAPAALNLPAPAAEPAPTEGGDWQPGSTIETPATNEVPPVEIETEDHANGLNPGHSHDRPVRLRNRSNHVVAVDVEDGISRTLAPGGEALIWLDPLSIKRAKADLSRSNGVLVLRFHD